VFLKLHGHKNTEKKKEEVTIIAVTPFFSVKYAINSSAKWITTNDFLSYYRPTILSSD